MNFYTKENSGIKRNSTDDVSRLLSSKLLLGWALLDDCCNIHFIPLLRSPQNKLLKECVLCVAEQEHCNNKQLNQKLRPVNECLEKNENNIYEKNDVSFRCMKNSELSESLQILECASNNVFSSLKRCCAIIDSSNIELELYLVSKIKMCVETLESLERCKAYFEKKC
ncbi:uncharacterized protein T551_00994 [Pneumocystis jirovecii RU7]|uniref:Uncharacterized protein n=1 Tax=Pneumocystis jirovecii (strain RU7) TaxID=1408657 RepID=A0A0W4ZTM4_PNEJ7|nr:uncharacterized protein T551_00994 [Pneumocystis jirovecii RU7]KTW31733.1 hypothetical protein T551_00994 [Pneumocystis jirovecii RU7]